MWWKAFRTYRRDPILNCARLISLRKAAHRVEAFIDEDDATTVPEYTVMLALIVLVAIGAISGIGLKVRDVYAGLDTGLLSAMGG
ncbi:MAG: hypothetical protein PVI86_17885 [Phycisphaerae bacterium]|jgi:Flp pilus assembly pilin Flp